jgi:hypothetical protein
MKQRGQAAYEAYYLAIGGWATGHHWAMISSDEQRAWSAVELACKGRSGHEPDFCGACNKLACVCGPQGAIDELAELIADPCSPVEAKARVEWARRERIKMLDGAPGVDLGAGDWSAEVVVKGAAQKHPCGHIGPSDNGPWYHCHVCQTKGCKACEVDALARAKSRRECCPTCYALAPSFVITPEGERCADPWHQGDPQKPKDET